MSTYEALLDLHSRLSNRFRDCLGRTDGARKGASLVLELVGLGMVSLDGMLVQRLLIASRRLPLLCAQAEESLRGDGDLLHGIETDLIRYDVAFVMNEMPLAQKTDAEIKRRLKELEDGLQESFELLELIDKAISDLSVPTLTG